MSVATITRSVFEPAGAQAALIAEVGSVLLVGGLLLFLFTMVLLTMAVMRRGRAVSPALWIFGAGLALPVAVLGSLFVYANQRSSAWLEPAPANALLIGVTGHLWWWELRYPGAIVAANELRLPAGRPVRLALASQDVLHSFWVPALGGKMDLVPGRLNHLTITAREAGVFRGQCAEYCGQQHARMALRVVVLEPAAFDHWLAQQARPAAEPATELARHGRAVFQGQGCAACHAVRSQDLTPAGGPRLGPDLTHVGSRQQLGAGVVANDAASMRRWVGDAQALKPGVRMPSYAHLDARSLAALAAYLSGLE